MAYTLFNLLVDVYDELGKLNVSQATSGSTTTIVDTFLDKNNTENNAWKGGTYFIIYADGASPEGLMGRITSSSASSQSFTFDAIATAVEAGDTYGYASQEYPLYQVIQSCNRGLRALGSVPKVDESLTVVTGQTEYALPAALKRKPPLSVWVATDTDADDQQWKEVRGWRVEPSAPGATALLIMPNDNYAGKTIKLIYNASHDDVKLSTDVINEYIEPVLAKWTCVHAALKWQNGRSNVTNAGVLQDLQDAKAELAAAQRLYKIWKPSRKARLMEVWRA